MTTPISRVCHFFVAAVVMLLLGGYASAQSDDREICLGRDPDTAISACTRILEGAAKLSPMDRAKILAGRGAARAAKDQRQLAIDDYTRAIETDPTLAAAYRSRGALHQRSGNTDGAIADYTQVLSRDAKDAVVYNARGLCYDAKGDTNRAIEDYSRAIEIKPNFDVALHNRGRALRRGGDIRGAIADYDRAIATNPKNAEYYSSRATAWLSGRQSARAGGRV